MSVPSIFSRLYEQAEAFSIINNHTNIHPALYKEAELLVSHWLDLLEFIVIYGSDIDVSHIGHGDVQALSYSQHHNYQLLASVIKEDLDAKSFQGLSDWYLFSWYGIVLGGTSPMTIIYTSPNVASEFAQHNINVVGFGGNMLFRDVVPLQQRSNRFKEFISGYDLSYPLPQVLCSYIHSILDTLHFFHPLASVYNTLIDSYGNQICIKEVPLLFLTYRYLLADSEYLIAPKKHVNAPLPLVLSESGLCGARYFLDLQWNHYHLPPTTYPLEERKLPGLPRIRYPYLSVYDFLEEKLLELPTNIDSKYFHTCSVGKTTFLLPIKQMFFDYFNIDDLHELYEIIRRDDETIDFRLKIPVRGGLIEFVKIYGESDIVTLNFNLAITPLFQLDNEKHHIISTHDENVKLLIGNSEIGVLNNDCITSNVRGHNGNFVTESYTTNDKWDYIIVRYYSSIANESVTGLIIPHFFVIEHINQECDFCVNMNDDYTLISHNRPHKNDAHPLCIDEPIVSILSPDDMVFKSQLQRWFLLPSSPNEITSPINSLLCVDYVSQDRRLLENYNIVFNSDALSRNDEGLYKIAVRDLHLPNNRERLLCYCEGLLFVMKQKALWKYNTVIFNLIVTVPIYLNDEEQSIFKDVWMEARQKSGTGIATDTYFISDSVVQASFLQCFLQLAPTRSFVNFNIDSLHTFISYCNNSGSIKTLSIDMGIANLFQTSRMFANDDSFVQHLIQNYFHSIFSLEKTQEISSLAQSFHWSLFDVLEFAFKNGKKREIMRCPLLGDCIKEVNIVFLIGILYYWGKYICERKLATPNVFVFSGYKYFPLFTCDIQAIERLIMMVLNKTQRNNNATNVKVFFKDHANQTISSPIITENLIITEEKDFYYGIDEIPQNQLFVQDILNLRDRLYYSYNGFLDILDSIEIKDYLYHLGLRLNLTNYLKNRGFYMSIDECLYDYLNHNEPKQICNEALFFWGLKHSLYEYLKTVL